MRVKVILSVCICRIISLKGSMLKARVGKLLRASQKGMNQNR